MDEDNSVRHNITEITKCMVAVEKQILDLDKIAMKSSETKAVTFREEVIHFLGDVKGTLGEFKGFKTSLTQAFNAGVARATEEVKVKEKMILALEKKALTLEEELSEAQKKNLRFDDWIESTKMRVDREVVKR